jgi:hypothetical protein
MSSFGMNEKGWTVSISVSHIRKGKFRMNEKDEAKGYHSLTSKKGFTVRVLCCVGH